MEVRDGPVRLRAVQINMAAGKSLVIFNFFNMLLKYDKSMAILRCYQITLLITR